MTRIFNLQPRPNKNRQEGHDGSSEFTVWISEFMGMPLMVVRLGTRQEKGSEPLGSRYKELSIFLLAIPQSSSKYRVRATPLNPEFPLINDRTAVTSGHVTINSPYTFIPLNPSVYSIYHHVYHSTVLRFPYSVGFARLSEWTVTFSFYNNNFFL
jgi:hypothetical protein